MKYRKTVNVWDPAVHAALVDGSLVLQPGQWVICGDDGPKSRFAGVTPQARTLVAAHPEAGKNGKLVVSNKSFRDKLNYWKGTQKTFDKMIASLCGA